MAEIGNCWNTRAWVSTGGWRLGCWVGVVVAASGGGGSSRPFWENVRGRGQQTEAPLPTRSRVEGRLAWTPPQLHMVAMVTKQPEPEAWVSPVVGPATVVPEYFDTVATLPELPPFQIVARATSPVMLRLTDALPAVYGMLRSQDTEGERIVLEAAAIMVNTLLTDDSHATAP